MNKPLFALILALGTLSFAQDFVQQPGGNLPPEVRARLEAMRPVFDLVQTVNLLGEVDKTRGAAFTKAQAQRMLPILRNLSTANDLKPADAERILTTLEGLLTPVQLQTLDGIQLKRQEEARARRQQGQGGNFLGQGGQRGGPGGQQRGFMTGGPFNPFKQGRAAENLQALSSLLAKK